jgi:hypothetical protein
MITKIYHHYEDVANELRIDLGESLPEKEMIIIVPVAGIHRVVASTIAHAKSLSPNIVAFYVSFSEEDGQRMQEKWDDWNTGIRLIVFKSRYRNIIGPFIEFIGRIKNHVEQKRTIMVLLPQFFPNKWWHFFLHNQSAYRLKSRLLKEKDIVVATVPYHLQE